MTTSLPGDPSICCRSDVDGVQHLVIDSADPDIARWVALTESGTGGLEPSTAYGDNVNLLGYGAARQVWACPVEREAPVRLRLPDGSEHVVRG